MTEEFKSIIGYEKLYLISNTGKVKSIKRNILLKFTTLWDGHLQVKLYKDLTSKSVSVHRLVAIHFIENPNNYPIINHIDENPQNNNMLNLEWCDYKYNTNYGNTQNKRILSKQRKISQYDLNNNLIQSFKSIKEVETIFPKSQSNIVKCCKGKYKQAYGYIWKYD